LPPNYALFRMLAAAFFLVDLLAFLPYAKVCLGRGYWPTGPLHGKALPLVLLAWAAAAVSLGLGFYPIVGAAVLWLLFRHFYIKNRWKNLFRGGGAPGFMSHHTTLFIVLLEAAALLDRPGLLGDRVFLMYRIDFGVILLCSGTYKSLSGYLHGEGMEVGLANPMWGYFFPLFRRLNPRGIFIRLQDIVAASGQLVMGTLLLFPQTSAIGAGLCILGFLGLIPVVRLGRLAALMAVIALLWLPPLGFHFAGVRNFSPIQAPSAVITALSVLIFAYIALLPFVKVMQYLSLFRGVSLPGPIQTAVTRYQNFVPIIMWRVFTPDVTNFFIRIYAVDRSSGTDRPLLVEDGTYAYREIFTRFRWSARFLHVTESIALTTVFTTLKYFRSQRGLFEERLIAYARTLGTDERLRFQYVSIAKGEKSFEYQPIADFLVDPVSGEVAEHRIEPNFDYTAPAFRSHIRETTGFGSYVPKKS
jgi:hypothetical protein